MYICKYLLRYGKIIIQLNNREKRVVLKSYFEKKKYF